MSLLRLLTAPFRRGPRQPLAARQPPRVEHETPLGMEALDLAAVDRVNRRNNALERITSVFERKGSGRFTRGTDANIAPMADDETYAARYARAFQTKDVKND